jgi:acetyl-CoA acyltransferase
MRDVFVIGVGMTRFAKYLDRSIKYLAQAALGQTLADANLAGSDLEAVWFSNSLWGMHSEQHCIRGQVALQKTGLDGLPIANVENACAGGATAFHHAWLGVASGLYDCTLAIGAEKVCQEDRIKMFQASWAGIDVENMNGQMKALSNALANIRLDVPIPPEDTNGRGKDRSVFMDLYSGMCRWHMANFGSTQNQLAAIASKNHFHSSLNPYAQFQKEMSIEEILNARVVSWPLTVPMCAPTGDGAAAAILCSSDFLTRVKNTRPVKILASVLASGTNRSIEDKSQDIAVRLSRQAYETAGVGPGDINLAEVHDATAYGELHQSEALGFCRQGEGGVYAETGASRLGGRQPINTSGGLESRGHPVGASGLGQIHELVTQLRHEAGKRQVENCRLALAENGGGNLGFEEAAMGIHILEKVD